MDQTAHYSSVKTRIRGYGRIANSLSNPPLFRGIGNGQKHPAEDLDDSKVPEWLKVYLIEIDRKLDQLLGIQSIKDISQDFPIDIEVLEISGNGIMFKTATPLKSKSIMEVVLVLDQVPLRMASTKGTVKAGKISDTWVMEFINIKEHDLEAIIKFVFSEQRERIRTDKIS
ncbi:hypothetical protein [Desulfovibrio gilichinskyi]|uniref:PilZ domain-containing protein n=1 Tax=Desulfovibrio gilichinskyi TaxID=1519643 RepID=A0A1X7CD02_9BACT|nr:hypothetical protein [Desulfovibrio gilichinskyi]SME94400.1 hypothetical protein SAMN06295933_0700 [Desulfovibrio gilichinskyi]